MFANFIYFIIVLLIYATYQTPAEANFTPLDTFIFFIGLIVLFGYFNWLQFRALQRMISRDSFTRLDHRYNTLLTRQAVMAIALFALDLYALNLPSYLSHIRVFTKIPTIEAVAFLALFIFYLAIVWFFAHGTYRHLYSSSVSRMSYVWSQISFSIPVLLPWLVLSGFADFIQALPFSLPKKFLSTTEGEVLYFMIFLLIVAMLGPAMIQKFWRCRPLEAGAARSRIEALCMRAEMAYANIMYWPIFGGRMITAGVMGLVKKFRYILVTRALLDVLEPAEIDAVISHEIGHIKHKHLIFYLMFFAGYMLLTYAVFDLIIYSIIYLDPIFQFFTGLGFNQMTLTSLAFSLVIIIIFLVYFRFIFGYFMRNFERQADTYVYTLFDSAHPLISTLEKIAITSGQPPDRPNWHHFSISERINYLAKCENDRSAIRQHDLKIKKSMAVYLVCMLVIGVIGYSLNFGETGKNLSNRFFEKIVLRELDKNPQDPNLYRILGDLYYSTENWNRVRQAYEKSLSLHPDNPHVLNNLAWLYATCDDKRFRNPERALQLALEAVSIIEEPHILDTLAESYYLNEYYEKAVEAAMRAKQTATDKHAYYEAQVKRFQKAAGH